MPIKFLQRKIQESRFLCKVCFVKFSPSDYLAGERLYRGFSKADLCEETGTIQLNAIKFPDFSCNWGRFSKPKSVRYRKKGKNFEGCFSFTVENACFQCMATPCHDPLLKNYSHTEIRQLMQNEPIILNRLKTGKLRIRIGAKVKNSCIDKI